MKAKRKLCVGCGKEQYIWKSEGRYKYCKGCWLAKVPTKPIKRTPIKPSQKPMRRRSHLRCLLLTQFIQQLRNVYLREVSIMCNASLPNVSLINLAEIHHKKVEENITMTQQHGYQFVEHVMIG